MGVATLVGEAAVEGLGSTDKDSVPVPLLDSPPEAVGVRLD